METYPWVIYLLTDLHSRSKNFAAVVPSSLDEVETPNPVKNNFKSINDHYGLDNEDISHPSNYKSIIWNQQKIEELIKIAHNNKDDSIKNTHGADKKYSLIR